MNLNRIKNGRRELALRLSTVAGVFACLVLLWTPLPLSAQPASSPALWNFGAGAGTEPFTISSSTGLSSLQVLTQGASGLDFTGSGCSIGATSCTLNVTFSPTANGLRYGAVVLADSGGTRVVPLAGVGTGAAAIFPPGTISTYAGNQYFSTTGSNPICPAGNSCPAASANFWGPNAFAYDGNGNLYIADWQNYVIRKVNKSGTISVFAGIPGVGLSTTGLCASSTDAYGDGCPATQATLWYPEAVVVDGAGNVFITDSGDNLVRKVDTSGKISVVVGVAGTAANPYVACMVSGPTVNDTGSKVSYSGDGGAATSAHMCYPNALAIDQLGNLYISDFFNYVIRMVTPGGNGAVGGGTISTIVGGSFTPAACVTGDDYNDGCPATQAYINQVQDLAIDASGSLYFTDSLDNLVRKLTSPSTGTGTLSLLAGSSTGDVGYSGDGGPAASSVLNEPFGLKLDAAGNVYFADSGNNVVRKISTKGIITTVAGVHGSQTCVSANVPTGVTCYSGNGGPATSAELDYPTRLWVDGVGNLLIADYNNNVIRKVDISDGPSVTFTTPVLVGSASVTDVTVANNGTSGSSLTVSSVGIPANFNLKGSGNTCSSSGFTLGFEATCVLGIEFEPTTGGSLGGNLTLTDDSVTGSTHLALSGTANAESQTITFANPGNQNYGGTSFTIDLSASASSTLPVTFTVTSGPAKVSGSTLTITGVGSVTVQAAQAGNAEFAPATSVSQTFNVVAASYTLPASSKLPAVSITPGSSGTAAFTVTSSNYAGTVSFTTSVTTTNGTAADVTAKVAPVVLKAGGTATATLTISTTSGAANHAPATPWKSGGALLVCAVLLGARGSLRRKYAVAVLLTAAAISLAGLLIACSSGTGSSPSSAKAARTYLVTVTPTGSGTVENPSAITVTATVQ